MNVYQFDQSINYSPSYLTYLPLTIIKLRSSSSTAATKPLQSHRLNTNESCRIDWFESTELIHRALAHVVQFFRVPPSSKHREVALVDSTSDLTVDRLLRRLDGAGKKLSFGREVGSIVEYLYFFGVVLMLRSAKGKV